MRKIYRFDVLDELVKGNEVYAIMFTRKAPIIENAATVSGRILARYLADSDIEWYASDEKEDEDEPTA